jgi:hypothetical protein
MPECELFKVKTVDGDINIQPPSGGREVCTFVRKEGIQSWWTCKSDISHDIMRQEGYREAFAVDVDWWGPEIERLMRELFLITGTKSVHPRKQGE